MADFWDYLDTLVASSRLVLDRPKGSAHPRYPELIYPLDYGYLDGTRAGDGDGIDVFVGSDPARELHALALTVDLHKRDAEMKLLLGCTHAEQQIVLDFLNGATMRACLVRRGGELAWLTTRRSVRRFRPQALPDALLRRVLETALRAPSAHNRQPWRFAVLTGPAAKERLALELAADFRRDLLLDGLPEAEVQAQAARSQARILAAPAVVVLCQDTRVGDAYPDALRSRAETMMGVQSVALAGGALLLAAHAAGLGGVWMCAPLFAPQAAHRALGLPEAWDPQAMILLGYPERIPAERERLALDDVAVFLE
jgi:F420 biosynthesis protein FbiB-like protein